MVKNTPVDAEDARDAGLIPGLGRSPEGENGNLLQYSCLENPMGRGAWWATVHGVAKSWTRLCMHPHKLLRTVSPLSPIFSPSGRDTHSLLLTHTPSPSYSWSQSQSLYCASQYAHPLFHTLSHTSSAVCFAGVLVQEQRGTSLLLVPVKWCVEPRQTRLSRPHEDAAEPAPVLSWPNTACSLETGKCRNWRSLWVA